MMHLTSVLLPAPFSPSSAWKVPAAAFTDTLSSARKSANRLVIETASMPTARMPWPLSVMPRLSDDAQFRRRPDEGALGRASHDHDQQGQDVGRGVEQVVA